MRSLNFILVAALLWAITEPAFAHARLIQSTPADGASLSRAPTSIVLIFNEAPEVEFSSIKLEGPDSSRVAEQTLLKGPNANSLALPLPTKSLPEGRYVVNFRVLSVDGHLVEGRTTFSIVPRTP